MSIVHGFGRGLAVAAASLVVAAASGADARAAERPRYGLGVEAERVGEQVLVAVRITETGPGGEVVTRSAPRLLIHEGRRGILIVGTKAEPPAKAPPLPAVRPDPAAPAPAAPAAPAPDRAGAAEGQPVAVAGVDDLASGLRVDVISIKGEGAVLVIGTAIEDGAVVWSSVEKVMARSRPEAK